MVLPLVHPVLRTCWRYRALAVPVALAVAETASVSGAATYQVRPGDTLSAIALRYHTTVARLVTINHLPGDGDLIYAGQTLRLSGRVPARQHAARTTVTFHTVVRGDTLDRIAARYHVKPAVIARRNHLPSSLVVVLGSRLAIPHRIAVHAAPGAAHAPTSAAARQDRNLLARESEPSRDETAALIRSTATSWGVDPRLALAIGWQESGWSMRAVSPVDAIGAMQVMRYTGSYLAANVVHRPLDLFNAKDNVTAGVALLSVLTHEASSTSQAIAGYYQGLSSVREHGMYASTKRYVADVLAIRARM